MDSLSVVQHFQTAMYLVALVALPPLLVAVACGLVISILQAATQIQDQTLPLAVKVVAVGLAMAALGSTLTQPLIDHANRTFQEFPYITR